MLKIIKKIKEKERKKKRWKLERNIYTKISHLFFKI